MADMEPQESVQATGIAQILGGAPVIDDGTMEDILDKLKLLDYETRFCPTGKPAFKPLSKSYFAVPSENPNAQFFYFTSLVSWLMTLQGHKGFPAPDQFDDPNATSTNILLALKTMGFTQTQSLPPNRIRQGHGEAVLTILTLLVDKALLSKGFSFRPIIYPRGDAEALEPDDSRALAAEGGDSDIDDNVNVDSDSGDEMYIHRGFGHKKAEGDNVDDYDMIVPQVSAEAWYLEVERVGPSLQIRGEEVRDWRARIEGATTLLRAVEKMYPEVRLLLEQRVDELKKAQDRIKKREQTLSQQFSEQAEEYRVKLRDLNAAQDSLKQSGSSVSQLSFELNQITEQLEQVKSEIGERETKISDSSPMMKIKEAASKIRSEIKEMSLRIGILQHTVLHYTVRQAEAKRERPMDIDENIDFETAYM